MSEVDSGISAVDAREFLRTPPNGPEVKMLVSRPDVSLLRMLPTLQTEVGLALNPSGWYIIRGDETQIPLHLISPGAQVLIHSHTTTESTGPEENAMPSLRDFLNSPLNAGNLIVSSLGITEYSSPQDYERRRRLRGVIDAFIPMFTKREERPEYLKFLEEIGAAYDVHAWEEIDPVKLAELLTPLK